VTDFEDFLAAAVRDMRFEPTAEQRHLLGLMYTETGDAPVRFDPALILDEVHKFGAQIPISRELLCDLPGHTCTADCPPPHVLPPVPLARRARYALRRCWWWLTGLRVAHKSRIDQGDD